VSLGTGTVIDCRQGEALILTCGHIFRDSAGKGRVEVDLFSPRGERGLAGQVIAWDLKRDLALVSIFTDATIDPVRVGGIDRATATGEPVVTVGCNGGQDPTIHHSRVTAVDKYLGPPNVQVAGQPVQGRSGGGLFGTDGTLIGVCNAADPTDNEGLFAALPSIHEQLDESGLSFVYRSSYPRNAVAAVAAADLPAMPAQMPLVSFDRRDRADALPTGSTESNAAGALSAGEQALVEQIRQHGGKAEVICIVRPHGAPQDSSEV
jgi:S1-C subfamily serine protease